MTQIKQTDMDKKTINTYFREFISSTSNGEAYVVKTSQENNPFQINKKDIEDFYNSYVRNSVQNEKDKKFDEVVKSILKDKNINNHIILNSAIWLWGLPNNRKPKMTQCEGIDFKEPPTDSVAGGGSGYVMKKVNGVRFILYILTQIWGIETKSSTEPKAIDKIVEICKNEKYDENYDTPDGVKNLLLHLCDPGKYEPIASTADKERIVKAFYQEDATNTSQPTLDAKIVWIKENNDIIKPFVEKGDFSFYKDNLPLLWKGENTTDSLSRVQALEFKKAMVLYGPPGTGKTYSAFELAKQLLLRYYLKNKKKDCISNILSNDKEFIKSKIHYLQFHINYTYENFIAGQVFDGNQLTTQKGLIYDIIEKKNNTSTAKNDVYSNGSTTPEDTINNDEATENGVDLNDSPIVVILDEMNRVDVSRVFGELFTAIEKRGEDVELILPDPNDSAKRLKLNIPDNIYFIGTMNEIDFSLEQLDFALRRRFVWEFSDYNEDDLESIIRSKGISLKDDDLNNFLTKSTKINDTITEYLGEEFHIGHAFFADIADIYNKMDKPTWKQAENVLWNISIKPILEAYCGTIDKEAKQNFINKCGNIFLKNT